MMRSLVTRRVAAFVLYVMSATPLFAASHGISILRVGAAQLNLGLADLNGQNYTNVFNSAGVSYSGGATPAAVDSDLFPVRNFSGLVTGQLGGTLTTTGPFTFPWDGGRSCYKVIFLNPATITNVVNATVINGSGAGNPTITGGCAGVSSYTYNSVTGLVTLTTSSSVVFGPGVSITTVGLNIAGLNGTFTAASAAGTTVTFTAATGLAGTPSGGGAVQVAGSVTVTWNTTNSPTYQFDGTYTLWGFNTTGKFYMARSANVGWNGQSDAVAYLNGIYWTPEMVSFIKALKPETLRPMGWNAFNGLSQVGSDVVNWAYRRKVTAFSFNAFSDFPPGIRCGGATSFCTISVSGGALTAAAADDTPLGGWVDGEQITGNIASSAAPLSITAIGSNGGLCQFTVSSTVSLSTGAPVATLGTPTSNCASQYATISTVDSGTQFTTNTPFSGSTCAAGCGNVQYQTLTITGKSGGAKLIMNRQAFPGTISSGNGTFTYNATLGAGNGVVLYSGTGINNAIPLEAQVQLANLVYANFWYNFPAWANDTFVTNAANLIYANLNPSLKGMFEYSNEQWNPQSDSFQWSIQMGIALGIINFSGANPLPYESLRIRQINGNLIPATSWGSDTSRLERLYCFQAGYGGTSFITGPMQGSSLASFGYNVSPSRPIDVTDSICYAPYMGGGAAMSGQSTDASATPTVYDAAVLNSMISNWNGGSQSAAIATLDGLVRGDIQNRVQTVTASGTTFTTPGAHNFSVNDEVRFTVTGGTTYSGIDLLSPYLILSTSSSGCPGAVVCNFTASRIVNGAAGSAVNSGAAGSGTTSVGYLSHAFDSSSLYGNNNLFGLMSGAFTKYQNMAVNGFSPAPAGGTPGVRQYEGTIEPSPPTAQQLINIGVTDTSAVVQSVSSNSICFSSMPFSTASFGSWVSFTNVGSLTGVSTGTNYTPTNIVGNCMKLIPQFSGSTATIGGTPGGATVVGNQTLADVQNGWRFDPLAAATMLDYLKAFKGTLAGTITAGLMPNSKAPSQLTLMGGGLWAINSNSSYVAPAPFQTYYGYQAFSAQ